LDAALTDLNIALKIFQSKGDIKNQEKVKQEIKRVQQLIN
jgi:hypothetical protein